MYGYCREETETIWTVGNLIRSTDKAILVRFKEGDIWLPKSQITLINPTVCGCKSDIAYVEMPR